jgi:hypothetical protein
MSNVRLYSVVGCEEELGAFTSDEDQDSRDEYQGTLLVMLKQKTIGLQPLVPHPAKSIWSTSRLKMLYTSGGGREKRENDSKAE